MKRRDWLTKALAANMFPLLKEQESIACGTSRMTGV